MSCEFFEYCIISQGFHNYKLLGASQQALPFIAIYFPMGNQEPRSARQVRPLVSRLLVLC